ncbi:methyltransferase domain-containing protein, partial [Salmonella enterica subsp. enterica serovar Minnesota]|uniref:methyltransferase domain-containing protein n=1 Tax=Salmonella enterica TaxID=28901 RepID=UPI003D2DD2B5
RAVKSPPRFTTWHDFGGFPDELGADLDLLVEWAAGARTGLDVGSGGGHVARRLREAGLEVVTVDPAPGMQAEVQAFAEDLPFADG